MTHPRLSSLVLMRVIINSAGDFSKLLDGCADLETFALYPATTSAMTPAAILQTFAAKSIPKLRKFTLAFFIRTAAQVQAITSGFADLLRAWAAADANRLERMDGMDIGLYFCWGRQRKDLGKIEMAMEKLRNQFRVENTHRVVNSNNLGFSFSFKVALFVENKPDLAPLCWLER
ncbi:hypothetical protein H0H81_001846 [Sphagnurus paluster]|uniref:Uncharacterized protein n=1 Tax=Sphagnurus paluster TaxID=117069 RepID=A0A9P7KF32_9AGAR|nr:hypothetical protein H0H81_001846 [Sphagnurus paluster]